MINILTPSRSRPELAKRMYDSAKRSPGCPIEIKFYLNEDDPDLDKYKSFLQPNEYIVGPNQSTSYSWNLMAEKATYDIFFLVGDDAQFTVENWGKHIINAFNKFPDKIVCVYPRVPTLSSKKNPHFCLHRNWINALGFFLPPHFYHWYVDTYVREVAQRINRFYCIQEFEMPIQNVKDGVSAAYHHSWQRQRDDWLWAKTERYREKDAETLSKTIREFKLQPITK